MAEEMEQKNKDIIRRVFEQIWEGGNLDVLDEIDSPEIILRYSVPGADASLEAVKQMTFAMFDGFTERDARIEDLIAEGDKVVERWSFAGKHTGEFMGLPPTNRTLSFSGISIIRMAQRKIVEAWDQIDSLGLFQQLGLIQMP